MRLLDLFCGAGGAGMGYHRAGFDVTGVDHRAQPRYPFGFVQGDALVFLERGGAAGFDAIHASPPCQAYSTATGRNRRGGARDQLALVPRHADLVAATREALEASGLPYVIENVVGAPLRDPHQLCGSSVGLDVRRHRLFETNWPLSTPRCAHYLQTPRFRSLDTRQARLASVVGVHGHLNYAGELELRQRAMGIDWMSPEELNQAIPPAYTELIGAQLRHRIEASRTSSVRRAL